MKIEAGKFYKTRDGRKVGPMSRHYSSAYPWTSPKGDTWKDNGSFVSGVEGKLDLIAEWTEEQPSPVRTVTCTEIVPGNYGSVFVGKGKNAENVRIGLNANYFTHQDLTDIIATLTTIRDAMKEQGE